MGVRNRDFEDEETPSRRPCAIEDLPLDKTSWCSTASASTQSSSPSNSIACFPLSVGLSPPHGAVRIWDDLCGADDKAFYRMSAKLEGELFVLCCYLNGKWCPLTVDRCSRLGATWVTQGHCLRLADENDFSSIVYFSIKNSKTLDPTRVCMRTASRGAYLLFVSRRLCERARVSGTAGSWERLEFRKAFADNPHIFNIYTMYGVKYGVSSFAKSAGTYFDDSRGCFMMGSHEPTLFALQSAACVELLH